MQWLRFAHNNQMGIALVELLIAIFVTGIVTGGVTMSIFQVFSGNARSSNHMTAVRQVQNAGYWISRDTQMAQNLVPTEDPDGLPLTLAWTEREGDEHQVVYTLLADNQLQREHYTNIGVNPDPDATTIVAEYINPDPAETNCDFDDGILVFTVAATLGTGSLEANETRVYRITPRPD